MRRALGRPASLIPDMPDVVHHVDRRRPRIVAGIVVHAVVRRIDAILLRGIERSAYLDVVTPRGALYAFPGVDPAKIPGFDDGRFAMELLETERVLVVPGSSFNVPYRDHLRFTFLPDEETLKEVFVRVDRLLSSWASRSK